jgi:chromodomain-helicase-DNA-binding protein 4
MASTKKRSRILDMLGSSDEEEEGPAQQFEKECSSDMKDYAQCLSEELKNNVRTDGRIRNSHSESFLSAASDSSAEPQGGQGIGDSTESDDGHESDCTEHECGRGNLTLKRNSDGESSGHGPQSVRTDAGKSRGVGAGSVGAPMDEDLTESDTDDDIRILERDMQNPEQSGEQFSGATLASVKARRSQSTEQSHSNNSGSDTSEACCACASSSETGRNPPELIFCDNCDRIWHLACVTPEPLSYIPCRFWLCPDCADYCSACILKESTVCPAIVPCRRCNRHYHPDCLDPIPDPESDHWLCSTCRRTRRAEKIVCSRLASLSVGTEERLRRINAWRARAGLPGLKEISADAPQSENSKGVDFLVKWRKLSHWHCQWVSWVEMGELSKQKRANFQRLYKGIDPFPERKRVQDALWDFALSPHTIPQRVIRVKKVSYDGRNAVRRYLVKWTGLAYDKCTWEIEESVRKAGFGALIDLFEARDSGGVGPQLAGTKLPHPLHDRRFEWLPGGELLEHQLEGLNWLLQQWRSETSSILADEMGLGKTIQSIAFLRASMLGQNAATFRPHVVIVPLTTMINWEKEFSKWAPDINVVSYHGTVESRTVICNSELLCGARDCGTRLKDNSNSDGESNSDDGSSDSDDSASTSTKRPDAETKLSCLLDTIRRSERSGKAKLKFHVMLTTYEVAVKYPKLFKIWDWDGMILDEGHRLKGGIQKKSFQELMGIPSRFRLLLTGTPLQNTVEELLALLSFIQPEQYGPHQIGAFMQALGCMGEGERVQKLQKTLQPFMLRRLKNEVLTELPSKKEFIVRVQQSREQRKVYADVLARNYAALKDADGKTASGKSLSNIVMELKKCCNHPHLVKINDDADVQDIIAASGKLQLVDKMLRKLKEGGHRVLIFSQMTALLDILQNYISEMKWGCLRLDGDVPHQVRQVRVEAFNADQSEYFVFLLSTRAGGQGINLTSADTVIIYDVDWNPHNDLQALSRAHRMGQENTVMVYRLITKDTIEEQILERGKQKLLLEHAVVEGARSKNRFTSAELNEMLKAGAEEIFSSENSAADEEVGGDDGAAAAARKQISWTDEDVDKLLDRTQLETEEDAVASSGPLSDLMASFKIAPYSTTEMEEEGAVEEEKQADVHGEGNGVDDVVAQEREHRGWTEIFASSDQWKLLVDSDSTVLKGKRTRRPREVFNVRGDQSESAATALEDQDLDLEDFPGGDIDLLRTSSQATGSVLLGAQADQGAPLEPQKRKKRKRRTKQEMAAAAFRSGSSTELVRLLSNSPSTACAKGMLLRFGLPTGNIQFLLDRAERSGMPFFPELTGSERSRDKLTKFVSVALQVAKSEVQSNPECLRSIAQAELIWAKLKESKNQGEDFCIGEVPSKLVAKMLIESAQGAPDGWAGSQDYLLLQAVHRHGFDQWELIMNESFAAGCSETFLKGRYASLVRVLHIQHTHKVGLQAARTAIVKLVKDQVLLTLLLEPLPQSPCNIQLTTCTHVFAAQSRCANHCATYGR